MGEIFVIGTDTDHEIFDVLRSLRDYSDDDITLSEYLILYLPKSNHYEHTQFKLGDLVKIVKYLDVMGYWSK